MGVGDDEADPGEPPVLQGAQEPGPKRLVLAVSDVDPEDLPGALGADPGGNHDRSGDDLAEGVVPDGHVVGVGPRRGAGISAGRLLGPPLRTGRAAYTASSSPRARAVDYAASFSVLAAHGVGMRFAR